MKADNRYIAYLDGFRGYSILFVLLGHFALAPMYVAQFGVTVFFFVSGFLITKLLINEYERSGTIALKDFYMRRIFRLYPALIFMLVVVLCILFAFHFEIIWMDIVAGLFYFTNYFLVYHGLPAQPGYLMVSNILWSLSVEEHFYLVFPVAFAFLYRRPRLFLAALTLSLLVFPAIRALNVFLHPQEAFNLNYYLTHSRGDSIVYGCVGALLLYRFNAAWYQRLIRRRWILALASVFLGLALIFRQRYFQEVGVFSAQGLGLFFLIPGFAFIPEGEWVSRMVNNRAIVFIGRLCYSLYLFHWVSLKLVNLYHPQKDAVWYLQVLPLTLGLALLSFYLVEQPFLALRRRFGSNARA